MSLQFDYSFENYRLAADELLSLGSHHRQRLRRALYHIGKVREHNVPEELREQFGSIDKRIRSGIPQNREGTLEATVNQISENEMNKLIDDILNFNQILIWWRRDNLRN
jgi:hypothetical protein